MIDGFALGCAVTGLVWVLREYLRHRQEAKVDAALMETFAQNSTWVPPPKRNRKKRK